MSVHRTVEIIILFSLFLSCSRRNGYEIDLDEPKIQYSSDRFIRQKFSLVLEDLDSVDVEALLREVSPDALKNLTSIAIYRCENINFSGMEKYANIKYLTLSVCKFTEIPDLTKTSLQHITIFGSNIDSFDTVFYPSTLSDLDISGTYKRNINGLRELENMKHVGIGRLMTSSENEESISIIREKNPDARLEYTMYKE